MKKLPLLLTIGILLLITGGYYLYTQGFDKKSIGVWDVVPADALAVYESDVCKNCIDKTKQTAVWKVIEQTALYNKPVDSLRERVVNLFEEGSRYLISVHPIKKDDFDFIFFTDQPKISQEHFKSLQNTAYKYTTREFSSVVINELRISNQIFSWCSIDKVWVASFTPFLIEDVIRTHNSRKSGFKKELSLSKQLTKIKGDAGNLYFKLSALNEGISLFSKDFSPLLNSFGKISVLDIKADEHNLLLNGFSIDSVNQPGYTLSLFQNQSPVSFSLRHLVPNRSVAVNNLGISSGADFNKDLIGYRKNKAPHLTDTLQRLSSSLSISFNDLYQSINDEVGVCFVESYKKKEFTKVLLVKTSQPGAWLKVLNNVSAKLSVDTIFYEKFGNYVIKDVPVFRFPEKLLWPLVSGFDETYYTHIGNTIIFGEDLEELKKVLTDIDEDDTWGKSVSVNRFLETTLLEANISFYVNTPKVWNIISSSLHPKWNRFVRDNQKLLNSLQLGAMQFSNLNHSYYTNISWSYKSASDLPKSPSNRERFVTRFNSKITRIHSVKSHVNKSDELLVQDSLNNLSLISSTGEVYWTKSIGDPIVGDIHQIDFFANGKLQYFFATKDALHVIDRLGNYVNPYPLRLPVTDIEFSSVVDYDHSKRYRFLIADATGKVWMYDKEGQNLEGWNPKDIGLKLSSAPRHHRIKGRDYIISIARNGQIFLTNRRGENINNFPIDLKARLSGEYFLETGRSIADTYFVVVDEDGFKIKFTVEGKVASRETLLKTSVSSKFSLLTEKSEKSYLIVQRDARQVNVIDDSGKRLVTNDFIGLNPFSVNYYNFGSGKTYISITDLTQELTYIYDGAGTLLSSPPVESSILSVRPKDTDEIKVFYVQGNSIVIE